MIYCLLDFRSVTNGLLSSLINMDFLKSYRIPTEEEMSDISFMEKHKDMLISIIKVYIYRSIYGYNGCSFIQRIVPSISVWVEESYSDVIFTMMGRLYDLSSYYDNEDDDKDIITHVNTLLDGVISSDPQLSRSLAMIEKEIDKHPFYIYRIESYTPDTYILVDYGDYRIITWSKKFLEDNPKIVHNNELYEVVSDAAIPQTFWMHTRSTADFLECIKKNIQSYMNEE